MLKVLFAISLVGLLACGTGEPDSEATGSTLDTPPVSAMEPPGDNAEGVEGEETAAIEGEQVDLEANAAAIESCIDLVASGDFGEALPVCLNAASIDAGNAEVQAALAVAQEKTAAEAASGAATAADALSEIGN
ncbi:MAG: hypothetical protein IH973_09925 [Myxococcales bacterium]|nr:hypothetical protein [Myxococcales bacterium]